MSGMEHGFSSSDILPLSMRLISSTSLIRLSRWLPEVIIFLALVVDDDFNTCDSVTSMLQQIGLRAEWTLSGKEAVLRTRQAVNCSSGISGDSFCPVLSRKLMLTTNSVPTPCRLL